MTKIPIDQPSEAIWCIFNNKTTYSCLPSSSSGLLDHKDTTLPLTTGPFVKSNGRLTSSLARSNNTLPPSHAKSQSPSSVASPISKGVNSTGYTIRTSSSKSSEPPTKTIAVEEVTKTSPEEARRRVKKVISPSFFYKQGRARVKCASPKVVYNIDPHENAVGFPLDKWPHWRVLFPHPPDGWAEIEHFQLDCSRHCKCNEHGGVELRPKLGGCSSKFKADKCAVALGTKNFPSRYSPTKLFPHLT